MELDHFFILTDRPKETGDLLVSMGLNESFCRDHKGQGTSNRRFEFSNGVLELLYLRDREEAETGPAKGLRFTERAETAGASPFGIILTRTEDSEPMPFDGWAYQPDYFDPPNAFHVGDNSETLEEPLCIYVPFMDPVSRKEEPGTFKFISDVQVFVPSDRLSKTLLGLERADRLRIGTGSEHLIVMTLDGGPRGLSKDLRPDLPLVIKW